MAGVEMGSSVVVAVEQASAPSPSHVRASWLVVEVDADAIEWSQQS